MCESIVPSSRIKCHARRYSPVVKNQMSCAKKYSARRQGSNVMREGIVPLSSIIDIYCLNLAHGDCPMKMKDFYVLCTKWFYIPKC